MSTRFQGQEDRALAYFDDGKLLKYITLVLGSSRKHKSEHKVNVCEFLKRERPYLGFRKREKEFQLDCEKVSCTMVS